MIKTSSKKYICVNILKLYLLIKIDDNDEKNSKKQVIYIYFKLFFLFLDLLFKKMTLFLYKIKLINK